jgi:hypothetical protein
MAPGRATRGSGSLTESRNIVQNAAGAGSPVRRQLFINLNPSLACQGENPPPRRDPRMPGGRRTYSFGHTRRPITYQPIPL